MQEGGKKSVGIGWVRVFEGTAIADGRVGVEVLLYSLPGAGREGRVWLGGLEWGEP